MRTNWFGPALAVLGLVALSISIPLSSARAQIATRQDDSQPPQPSRARAAMAPDPFQGQPGMPGMPGGMMQGPMMGGGSPMTMISDGAYLYVGVDRRVVKISKESMKVVGTCDLGGPQMRPGGMAPRAPSPGFGGGLEVPPPPPGGAGGG